MTTTDPQSTLTDDDIETVWKRRETVASIDDPQDADGTDADGTDGDATDSTDGDATDSTDGDGGDADGQDA